MELYTRIFLILYVFLSVNLHAQSNDTKVIQKNLEEWITAFNDKNTEKALSIYNEDFMGYYPEQKEQTLEDIKEQQKTIFNNKNLSVKLEIDIIEIETSGNLAFVRMILKAVVKPTYSTQPAVAWDKGIQVWQKNNNGEWKLKRSSTFPYTKR